MLTLNNDLGCESVLGGRSKAPDSNHFAICPKQSPLNWGPHSLLPLTSPHEARCKLRLFCTASDLGCQNDCLLGGPRYKALPGLCSQLVWLTNQQIFNFETNTLPLTKCLWQLLEIFLKYWSHTVRLVVVSCQHYCDNCKKGFKRYCKSFNHRMQQSPGEPVTHVNIFLPWLNPCLWLVNRTDSERRQLLDQDRKFDLCLRWKQWPVSLQ